MNPGLRKVMPNYARPFNEIDKLKERIAELKAERDELKKMTDAIATIGEFVVDRLDGDGSIHVCIDLESDMADMALTSRNDDGMEYVDAYSPAADFMVTLAMLGDHCREEMDTDRKGIGQTT